MDFGNIVGNLVGSLDPNLQMLVTEYQRLMSDGKIDGSDTAEIVRLLEEFAQSKGINTTLVDEAMKFINK